MSYPAKVQVFARRLRDEKGYSLSQIHRALERQGFSPSKDTVAYWVLDGYAERKNAKRAALKREQDKRRRHERMAERVRAERDHEDALLADLRRQGLSLQATAIAARYFAGIELKPEQVRYRTRDLGPFPRGVGRSHVTQLPFRRTHEGELARTRELRERGLSHRQIGERLGLTPQAVGARLKKADGLRAGERRKVAA